LIWCVLYVLHQPIFQMENIASNVMFVSLVGTKKIGF